MLALVALGCSNPASTPAPVEDQAVALLAIAGVTPPALGQTPVTAITATAQYARTVTWSPEVTTAFAGSSAYTATISLTPTTGFTLMGVATNSFTVAGATSGTNPSD